MSGIALAPAPASAPAPGPAPTSAPSVPASGQGAAPAPVAPAPGVSLPAGSSAPAPSGDAAPWYSGLAEDNRKIAEAKQWKTMDDALKSYKDLETAFSGKIDALAPKSAAEYDFAVPKNAEQIGYDKEFAGAFKEWAHKAKLSKESAAALHDQFVEYAASQLGGAAEAQTKQIAERVDAAERALQKEWGAKDNPAFNRSLEMARRAIDQLGLSASLDGMGVTAGGKVANAEFITAMAKVGARMFSEDAQFGTAASTTNPFAKESFDTSSQGALVQKDPHKALLLIQALPAAEQARYSYLLGALREKLK